MSDKKLTDQHKDALTPKTANNFGPYIETDPAANDAANQVISIIMGDLPRSEDDDAEWGVPKALLDKAGKALANRYCFAVEDMEGDIAVMITPTRYFVENGCCDDQTGPIDHLLPRAATMMESCWEIYEDGIETAADAALHLQKLGFFWNRDFQNFIDASQTDDIAKALAPQTVEKPANTGGAKPKF